ncbi:hypothetical protein B566_EDAN006128 [Ephemera danica]|nr:hypothetical protein B566_EDAN006128 [Ephemera danica]
MVNMNATALFTLRAKITRLALTSRVFIIALQCLSNIVLPDHDAGVFVSPLNPKDKFGICDRVVQFLLGGLVRWDAQYFLHIAKYGYTYENCLAFFPLLPMSAQFLVSSIFSPFTLFFTEHSLIIIAFVVINIAFFVKAAQSLFDLSLVVLRDEEMAYKSAVFFCFTPASVFFSAPYSESLFALCTFHGLLCNELNRTKTSAISLGLACATRSNGILNIGFPIYKRLRAFLHSASTKSLVLILLIPLQFIGVMIPLLASVAVTLLPFVLFQVFSFGKFCIDDRLIFPDFIMEHAEEYNYKLPGTNPSDWCNSSVPLAYSYIQSHYWNVGFLKYYQFKQIPNFLLALPVIWLVLYLGVKFFIQFPKHVLLLGLGRLPRLRPKGVPPAEALPYILHAVCLLIFCILCIHIQVTTRMLASSSPVLYWAAAYLSMPHTDQPDKHVESRENMASYWRVFLWNQSYFGHITAKCIKFYFLSYMILGTMLFSNHFPWT